MTNKEEKVADSKFRNILNQRISFQSNAWSSINKEISIHDALTEIKGEKHRHQVSNLRSLLVNSDFDGYNNHKKNLPAVTFCGTFDGTRRRENLKHYSYVIVLDVDKLNVDELVRVKECFFNEAYVFAFWESPSQKGIKGLVHLSFSFEISNSNVDCAHKGAFQKLATYFKGEYNITLDDSGSDTTRLCFFSYDPTLHIKKEVNSIVILEGDIIKIQRNPIEKTLYIPISKSNRDVLYNPKDRNNSGDRYTIRSILRFLEKRKISITYSYDEWYKVAMAIANSFTYDIGEKYFLRLSSLDDEKFNERNCKEFLANCYDTRSGSVNFSTIVFLAIGKGYLIGKSKERGSETAD